MFRGWQGWRACDSKSRQGVLFSILLIFTMNPTTLFDEMHGSTASIEITSHQRYKKLLHLVDDARRALLINANLRQPYVELLHSLYKADSGACHKINRIRPIKPEDKDILQHIENHFPAVVLAEPPPSDEPFTWGFTWVGIDSVNDKKIYLNGDLVNFWLRKTVRCFPTSYFQYNDPLWSEKEENIIVKAQLDNHINNISSVGPLSHAMVVSRPMSYTCHRTDIKREWKLCRTADIWRTCDGMVGEEYWRL